MSFGDVTPRAAAAAALYGFPFLGRIAVLIFLLHHLLLCSRYLLLPGLVLALGAE